MERDAVGEVVVGPPIVRADRDDRIGPGQQWKTCSGRSRSAIPWMKLVTVASSWLVVNEVVSHSPNDQAGGSAGRPVSAV